MHQDESKTETNPSRELHSWERDALIQIAQAGLIEQRRARRWGIFFKLLGFAYLIAILILVVLPRSDDGNTISKSRPAAAVIDIHGIIAAGEATEADSINRALRQAFEADNIKGIILNLNSPGGSPVQAGRIYDEIMRLKAKHPDKPVYAVINDICASGGYYVAAAADEIIADRASIVGSIGVRMDSFGFVDSLEKLGVERRLLTAGENKALMDPFLPIVPEQVDHLQTILDNIHVQFIDAVRNGRGDRLIDDERIFSGLVWSGEQSLAIGLVDELGDIDMVLRDKLQLKHFVDMTPKKNPLERLFGQIETSTIRIINNLFTPKLQ
ncbi:MAG TPA: signal peptide peptidase SppA [Halothiobacillus sp.]|nr:signal peptide peptidase SppA [Halothiobacillus sp.]